LDTPYFLTVQRLVQYDEDFVESYLSKPDEIVGEMKTLKHEHIPDTKSEANLAKMLYQVTVKCQTYSTLRDDVTRAQAIVS